MSLRSKTDMRMKWDRLHPKSKKELAREKLEKQLEADRDWHKKHYAKKREQELRLKEEQRQRRQAKNQARLDRKLNIIFALRLEGKTMREIGRGFGVTPERIRQLILRMPYEKRMLVSDNQNLRKVFYKFNCAHCKKENTTTLAKRKFCNMKCRKDSGMATHTKYNYPPEIKTAAQRVNWLFHNNPEWRAQYDLKQQAWREKTYRDPKKRAAHNAKMAIYVKRYNEKKQGKKLTPLPK